LLASNQTPVTPSDLPDSIPYSARVRITISSKTLRYLWISVKNYSKSKRG
jgi:hypothetical protein